MTKAKITVANAIDLPWCTISSTVAPMASFQLAFLQNIDRNKWTRITAGAPIDIKFTWGGESVLANMCSLVRVNSETADTDRFRAYASSDWTGAAIVDTTSLQTIPSLTLGDLAFGVDPLGSNLYDSFLGQKMCTRWFSEQTIGSAILTIDATNNAQGWFDMARFWIGRAYELNDNPIYGKQLRWAHNGVRGKRSKGGGPKNSRGAAWREIEFDLKSISDADAEMWLSAARLLLEDGDFHFSIYPAGTAEQIRNYTGLFIFEKMPGRTSSSYAHNDSSTLIAET